MGNKPPMGHFDSWLANLHCLLDSRLPPIAPLHKDPHSAFETEIKPFICLVGTSVASIERTLNTIVTDLGTYLKSACPTALEPAMLTKSLVSIGDAAPPPPGTATNAVPTPDGPPCPDGTPNASMPFTNRWRNVNLSSFGFDPLPRVYTTPRPPPPHQHPSLG